MNCKISDTEEIKMDNLSTQSTIYIGLNDGDTKVQRFEDAKYLSILKNTCRNYGVAFSVQMVNGGYFHEDGHYTEENTLMLGLMNVPEQTVTEIAKDLCAFFNQESVMVTTSPVSVVFIKESL